MTGSNGSRAFLRRLIPSPSMGVALLALMVALSGTAYAAAKINGKNIKKGTVSSKQIKNNSVTGGDIRNSTIKSADVADGSLGAGDLAAGVIPTVPGPAPIGTATSTTNWAVTGLLGDPDVPGMNLTYTVPAGANKIVATFTAECQVSTTVDDQSIISRILIDGTDADPAGYSTLCGPGDADDAGNTGSAGESLYTSGVITRTLSVAPGAHTIQVQTTQGLAATATLDNMSLVVTSGS